MTEMVRKTVRVRIIGRVQGVWFRGWTIDQAHELQLHGWVRNRRDGSVEAVISGSPDLVEEMVGRCRIGPAAAAVDRVEVVETAEMVAFGFHQKPTV
ncbi:MAG TPA: acylphosphatase [Alphaproteobacteria bacterium]|nr:acylphosphatase [Alphaproteobacteria bacterium]